jgi:hypothetical protein
MASAWLLLAVAILIGTYLSIPVIENKTLTILESHLDTHNSVLVPVLDKSGTGVLITITVLSSLAIGFACFFLSRTAFIDFEFAAKFLGLADAICIAGGKLEDLEKASQLFVPKSRSFGMSDMIPKKDRETFMELVKCLRGGKVI